MYSHFHLEKADRLESMVLFSYLLSLELKRLGGGGGGGGGGHLILQMHTYSAQQLLAQ